MLNLFISINAYQKIVGEVTSHSTLFSLLTGEHVIIYLTDDILFNELINEEINLEESNIAGEIKFAKSLDIEIRDGREMSRKLIKSEKLKNSEFRNYLQSSIFILDVNQRRREEIEKKLGVLCIPQDSMQDIKLPCDKSKTFLSNEIIEDGWKNIISPDIESNVDKLPINSVIISDRFLIYNEENCNYYNLKEILRQMFEGKQYDFPIRLFVLYAIRNDSPQTQTLKYNFIKRTSKQIYQIFNEFRYKEFKQAINLEYIICDNTDLKKWPLYESLHGRFILTNYYMITADKGLSAFKKSNGLEVSNFHQIICRYSQFGSPDSRDNWYKCRSSLAKILYEAIEKERNNRQYYKISTDVPYVQICPYICAKIQNNLEMRIVEMDKFNSTNRLITEIQDGDPCYHIIIDNDNDWANAKVSELKPYVYSNYQYCYCSKDLREMNEICEKIKKLFRDENFHYEQVKEKGEKFFRIYVPYPSNVLQINYKESADCENAEDQYNNYHNNCFKNEHDAIEVANKICDILKIDHIKQPNKFKN